MQLVAAAAVNDDGNEELNRSVDELKCSNMLL